MRNYIIRLKRIGRWRKPVYEVVVSFSDVPVTGNLVEKLGFYSPLTESKIFFINLDRLAFWLLRGARVSETVGLLLGKMAPRRAKVRLGGKST